MNKFLKILTLAGVTSAVSVTGMALTDLKLNTNYKMNTEVNSESSDFVARRPEEINNQDIDTITNSTNEQNDLNIEDGLEISPKTLEETENNEANESNTNNNESLNTENTTSNLEENLENSHFISEEDFNLIITSLNDLKEDLDEFIVESKNLAEKAKNNQNTLNEEQKTDIQLKVEELNTEIMNVKENVKDLNCTLTGECESFDNELKSFYFNEILKLNNKINMLQDAMQMQGNPYFRFYQNPYSNFYGFSYYYSPNQDEENYNEEQNNQELNSDENSETVKKNTFNLPNNLDTYGPTRRNIDTFFNTALFNENGMYNNMLPYGYMPYNNFGYGMNGYNNFNNSNYMNKNASNNQSNTPLTVESSNDNSVPTLPEEINKKRPRFAKNIDTYTNKPMNANINSMNGMRITDYFKQKINNWFNKKANQEEVNNYVDSFIEEQQNKNNISFSEILFLF